MTTKDFAPIYDVLKKTVMPTGVFRLILNILVSVLN